MLFTNYSTLLFLTNIPAGVTFFLPLREVIVSSQEFLSRQITHWVLRPVLIETSHYKEL